MEADKEEAVTTVFDEKKGKNVVAEKNIPGTLPAWAIKK
jgi:hypothetical protein